MDVVTLSLAKKYTDYKIGEGVGFEVKVVDELPETGEPGIIYFTPNSGEGSNIYDEYIWVEGDNNFEKIGSTEIDINNLPYAFKIVDAPASTTLTNDEITLFENGCKINGNFAGLYNATYFPCCKPGGAGVRHGYVFSASQNGSIFINLYNINSNNVLSISTEFASSHDYGTYVNLLNSLIRRDVYGTAFFLGKQIPNYPSDTTKQYALELDKTSGNLNWNEKLNYGLPVIDAPSSTTLTADQVSKITAGCQINGTFMGRDNLIFFPAIDGVYSSKVGVAVGVEQGLPVVEGYRIDSSNIITFGGNFVQFDSVNHTLQLSADWSLRLQGRGGMNLILDSNHPKFWGKAIPSYPSDTTKSYALEQNASTGALAWNPVVEYGFEVMNAPSSGVLSDEQYQKVLKGVLVKGTFLDCSNPLILPPSYGYTDTYTGIIVHKDGIKPYTLTESTKTIAITYSSYGFTLYGNGHLFTSELTVKNKLFPSYPSDVTKQYKFVQTAATNGPLAWQEDTPIVSMTAAQYASITPDENTLYLIQG